VGINIKKILGIIVPLVIGIALIYYQFTTLNTEQISQLKKYLTEANYFWIFLSLFIALFGFWSRAYRWKYSLNHLGYKTNFWNDFFSVCISYFVNLTIPRSGELTRALLLKKYENVPFDKGFGTIVAERVVDLAIFLLFVTAGFILQFDTISGYIFKYIPLNTIIILASLGFAGFIALLLLWKYSKLKPILFLKAKLSGLVEGILSIFRMKKKGKYIFHSFFIWFSYLMMFYVTIFAIPETSNIGFDIVIMAFIFGSVAVGFTSGGLGAFPVAIQTVLFLFGIQESAGAALGWLVWASQTMLTIFLGILSYILLHFINKKSSILPEI
jgi:glycosyltransferase 2 family protein